MAEFSDWEFLLDGNVHELRDMSQKNAGFYFNVYGGIDDWNDCPNSDFRMTSHYCEGEDDPNVVWQVGYELISLFNGASCLFDRNYQKFSTVGLLKDGLSVPTIPPVGSSGLLLKPAVPALEVEKSWAAARKANTKVTLLHLATENEDAYLILKYLDMPGDWVTYYKLLDTLKSLAEKNGVDLRIDKGKLAAFGNTANNFSLSGFDSRHGFKDVLKENKTPAMHINDGHRFITDLARSYLRARYFAA